MRAIARAAVDGPADERALTRYLSKTIELYRLERGLSQHELAELCGVSQPAVAHWERGERTWTLDTIAKVARGLKLPIGVLLYPFCRKAWTSFTPKKGPVAHAKRAS